MSGHSDLGIFNNFDASSILTWVKTDTASAACPAYPGSLEIMSMTFAAVICDVRTIALAAANCCCECPLLFSVTFGAGRGVESLDFLALDCVR